jgi:hypothetical protein
VVSDGIAKVGLPVDAVVGVPRDGAGTKALVKLKLEKGFAAPAGAVGAVGAAPGAGGAVEDTEDSAALGFFHLLIRYNIRRRRRRRRNAHCQSFCVCVCFGNTVFTGAPTFPFEESCDGPVLRWMP